MTTEESYAAFFNSSPDAILVVDSAGVIRDANPTAGTMFGYGREELVGREMEMLLPERSRAAHVAHRRAFTRTPTSRPMGIGLELSAQRKDGTELAVEIGLSPATSKGEALTIAAVRDVSQSKRLRAFGAAALRASEGERMRIARELHDDTAQRLSALLLRLRLLERDAPAAAGAVQEFREAITSSLEEVRRIARSLRPPELEDAGIAAALRAHARGLRDATGFDVTVDADPVDALLDTDQKLVLYRVVQEALANAARHSGETSARVTVRRVDDTVVTTVSDAGSGFVADVVRGHEEGLGLLGIHERTAAVGGRVRIDTQPGVGTNVVLTLPGASVGPVTAPSPT